MFKKGKQTCSFVRLDYRCFLFGEFIDHEGMKIDETLNCETQKMNHKILSLSFFNFGEH